MNKEEFLAMSLPYGLKVYVKYSHNPDNSELETMIGLIDDSIITDRNEEDMAPLSVRDYGICLHPLSDLTKPITHKGETFVPLCELVNVMFSKYPRNSFIENDKCYVGNVTENGDTSNAHCYRFMYDKSHNSFSLMTLFYSHNNWCDHEDIFVANQIPMMLKLIEWHFDIAGIIEKGEAIDVNTLDKNPYE